MIVVWKVLGALLAAVVVGGFLVTRGVGDSAPPPDPGPPVVLTEPARTAPTQTLNPDDRGNGDGKPGTKPGTKPGQQNGSPRTTDDDDDDDDLYPEVEDHEDDGDDDDDDGDDD